MIDDTLQANEWYSDSSGTPRSWVERLGSLWYGLTRLQWPYRRRYVTQQVTRYWKHFTGQPVNEPNNVALSNTEELPPTIRLVQEGAQHALHSYIPRPYEGHLRYVYGIDNTTSTLLFKTLKQVGIGDFSIRNVPGYHLALFMPPYVERVGHEIHDWLDEVQAQAKVAPVVVDNHVRQSITGSYSATP